MKTPTAPGEPDSDPSLTAEGARLLLRVATALTAAGGPEEAATQFLQLMASTVSGRAWLALCDAGRQAAIWYPAGGIEPLPLRLAAAEGSVIAKALLHSEATWIPDPGRSADFPERRFLRKSEEGAWAFLPLSAAGQTLGCLVLRAARGPDFDPHQVAVLKSVLPAASMLLNASLHRRQIDAHADEATSEIALLFNVAQSLSLALQPEEVVRQVGLALSKALPADLLAFTLLRPEPSGMSVLAMTAASDAVMRRFTREVLGEAGRHMHGRPPRLPVIITGPADKSREPLVGASSIASMAHAPLIVRGELLGLISAGSRISGAFGERHMRLMLTVANQSALTLDRLISARESEIATLHSMLESMVEGVLLLDSEQRIVISNPAAQAHLRLLNAGRMPTRLTKLGGISLNFAAMDAPGAVPAGRTFDVTLAEESRIFSVTCSPLRRGPESTAGIVVVLSDVTQSRTQEAQRAQSEKLSALGEMISGVAHELNNPLASVIGNAQLLADRDVDDEIRRKLQAIDAEATRCRKIVQNLLRFARRHTPEKRPLDVNKALDSVLQLLGHQLEVEGILVRVEMQKDIGLVVGDFHLLLQVFMNITFNAFQAMKEKEGPGLLSVRTRRRGGRVIVEIADSGPGITPSNLKRIFDPFFSTKEVGKGTGLGLSLAYGTVREHGGSITARSKVGVGTTFVIDLPAASEAELKLGGVMQDEMADVGSDARAVAAPPPAATGRRILVVEDERSLAEVMLEILQSRGHQVDIATDGRSAKARVSEQNYDLIISDMKMPNMSGREFYRQVVAAQPELARRIIFSTGDTANPETQAFFEEVGSRFLAKPFNLTEMLLLVDAVLDEGSAS